MSTPNPFEQPGTGGDKFDLKNLGQQWLGGLLIIWPSEVKPEFTGNGQYKPTDVVVADIGIIDRIDPNTGRPLFFKEAFIFSKGLVANTRNKLGQVVLGRLVKRDFANGPGWSLDPYQPQDVATAEAYLATNPRQTFSPPTPAQQAAAPTPAAAAYSAPAPAPAPNAAPNQWQPPAPATAPTPAPSSPAPTAGANTWAPPPPAPSANGIESWPAGLADYLKTIGVDPAQVPDEATARMIAATGGRQ
ncbi:hypothetical protein [Streptomyces sp. NPDC001774]